MGYGRIFLNTSVSLSLIKDLSNEPNFGCIHLTGQHLSNHSLKTTNLHMCVFFQYERMVLRTFLSSVSTSLQTLSVTYSPPPPHPPAPVNHPLPGLYRGGPAQHGPFWPCPPSPAGRDQLTRPAIPCRPRPVDPARTYTPVVTKLTSWVSLR